MDENSSAKLAALAARIEACRACPRLVEWREHVAREKRASFAGDTYWGRPVAGFGDPAARLVVVGLAPAAHGANRTGRIFTGDRSGDWLFRAMHRARFANQPTSTWRDDGLALTDAWVTAAVRCAPPANKPLPSERDNCAPFLREELQLLTRAEVFVVLGSFAFTVLWRTLSELGVSLPRPRPKFGHQATISLADGRTIICSYHPSQQNTFTGTLTEQMFDAVFTQVRSTFKTT